MTPPLLSRFLYNCLVVFSQVISFVGEFCSNQSGMTPFLPGVESEFIRVLFILTASVICLSSALSLYPVMFILYMIRLQFSHYSERFREEVWTSAKELKKRYMYQFIIRGTKLKTKVVGK